MSSVKGWLLAVFLSFFILNSIKWSLDGIVIKCVKWKYVRLIGSVGLNFASSTLRLARVMCGFQLVTTYPSRNGAVAYEIINRFNLSRRDSCHLQLLLKRERFISLTYTFYAVCVTGIRMRLLFPWRKFPSWVLSNNEDFTKTKTLLIKSSFACIFA